ncbi:MAG: c-type cytochrome biogenesis protein CcmI [Rhodospirillaceae bacterium]|nr:c-type cytochrome biogenesis protein CcmI [Rhodospirillales bacterium]
MIWVLFAAMTVATVALLLVPLLRVRPNAAASRAEYDLTVYKDQLAEVDREVERGTVSADQAEAARTEIQRRILAMGETVKDKPLPRRMGLTVALVAAIVPVVAFGLYVVLGQPWLPGQPYATRTDTSQTQDQAGMIQGMVAQLQARLDQNPKDGKGWAMLGRSYRVLGDTAKATESYKKAAALLPGDVQVRMEYGALLLAEVPAGAMLPPDFVNVMREVLAADAKNVDALYFLGVSEGQLGNNAKAKDLWTRLVVLLPEGSEDRAEVQKQIDGLK